LLLWLGSYAANSLLADSGGVIVVDDSNRLLIDALQWFRFILASPLYLFLAPRGFDAVWTVVAGIVANSLLVGFGLSGAIRMIAKRQFGIRTLFALTTITALCLFAMTFQNDIGIFIILATATVGLLCLAFANVRPVRPVSRGASTSDIDLPQRP